MQKCLARGSVHVPAKTRVHTCTQPWHPRMHKCTLHACTDALSAKHSSRWARDLREGMQYRAARAATTPFFRYSQPSTPAPPCAPPRPPPQSAATPAGPLSARLVSAHQSRPARGSEQGRGPQPVLRVGEPALCSLQPAAGPLAAAAAAASGQAVPAHRVAASGGAGAAGGLRQSLPAAWRGCGPGGARGSRCWRCPYLASA